MSGVAVVIPYFQRAPGVLRRALDSVFSQTLVPDSILVVDDGSPSPARDDLATLPAHLAQRVTLIEQVNQGVGPARNAALDRIPAGTRFVAFLDSDDHWRPGHLERAVTTLECGYDLYFSNFDDPELDADAFTEAGFGRDPWQAIPGTDSCHTDAPGIDLAVRPYPIITPTVVYRFDRFRGVRFPAEFRTAEVWFFWLALLQKGARVCCSFESGAVRDRGVNIHRSHGYGSSGRISVQVNFLCFRASLLRESSLGDVQCNHLKANVAVLRRDIALQVLHRIRRRQDLPWADLRKLLRFDPMAAVVIPLEAVRMTAGRILK